MEFELRNTRLKLVANYTVSPLRKKRTLTGVDSGAIDPNIFVLVFLFDYFILNIT